jgi:hypothetical protein
MNTGTDLSAPAPTITCGTNTALDQPSQSCKIQKTVCGPGTVFNDTSATCQLDMNHGTMIWTSTHNLDWSSVWYKNTSGDAGTTYDPVGTEGGPMNGIADATLLFMADGDPMGGLMPQPVTWATGAPDSTVRVANDKQLSITDWKNCKTQFSLYRNPPNGKAGDIRVVVQVQGCPANMNLSVWHVFNTTDQYDDIYMAAPLGGVPDAFNVNADGTGYFERDLDPNIWFKAGQALEGATHGPAGQSAKIPSLTDFPGATYSVDLIYHNNGQSNGNAFWCARDAMNNCVTPPSPNLLLPGQYGIDVGAVLTGSKVKNGGSASAHPAPLGMLQPM